MKPLDITTLQEFSTGQMALVFKDIVKQKMQAMGWKKGDRILIHRHGKGFFFDKIEGRQEVEATSILVAKLEQQAISGKTVDADDETSPDKHKKKKR